MGRLDDKVAIITGGARGQGAAEAKLFASEGARVVITDVLEVEGKQTAHDLGDRVSFMTQDVTSPQRWAEVVDAVHSEYGSVDVLVNNAGIFAPTPLLASSYEDYLRIIEINQHGVFLGMRTVAPIMVAQKAGSIINISSIAGLSGSPGFLAYSTSKWAVRGMTRAAAKELAATGVRINSVHPGIIDTPMARVFDDLGVRAAVDQRIPNGREATADDVAKLVLYLASDDSTYSTGSEFVVDGGWTA